MYSDTEFCLCVETGLHALYKKALSLDIQNLTLGTLQLMTVEINYISQILQHLLSFALHHQFIVHRQNRNLFEDQVNGTASVDINKIHCRMRIDELGTFRHSICM